MKWGEFLSKTFARLQFNTQNVNALDEVKAVEHGLGRQAGESARRFVCVISLSFSVRRGLSELCVPRPVHWLANNVQDTNQLLGDGMQSTVRLHRRSSISLPCGLDTMEPPEYEPQVSPDSCQTIAIYVKHYTFFLGLT